MPLSLLTVISHRLWGGVKRDGEASTRGRKALKGDEKVLRDKKNMWCYISAKERREGLQSAEKNPVQVHGELLNCSREALKVYGEVFFCYLVLSPIGSVTA